MDFPLTENQINYCFITDIYHQYLYGICMVTYWFTVCTRLFPITLWLFNIAMENDPFIDGLPSYKMGGFSIVM